MLLGGALMGDFYFMDKKELSNKRRSESLKLSWKKRKDYVGKTGAGTLHNVWRSRVFTKKGKKIGFSESWNTYKGFINDIPDGYVNGQVLIRFDKSKPFSKDNCYWGDKGQESKHRLMFEYNGKNMLMVDWCIKYGLNYNGVKQRYYAGENYTKKEILFGKKRAKKRKLKDVRSLGSDREVIGKVSKMMAQYKNNDKLKGLESDIDRVFVHKTIHKKCTYCGTKKNVGLDRIDNSIGHLKSNCIPACYRCNITRSNNFTVEEFKRISKVIIEIDKSRLG